MNELGLDTKISSDSLYKKLPESHEHSFLVYTTMYYSQVEVTTDGHSENF